MYVFQNPSAPSIAYSISRTPLGWSLDVNIHGRVPASDRVRLIEWLRAYSLRVKSAIAGATTTFRVTPTGYSLEVVLLTRAFIANSRRPEQLDLALAYA